MQHPESGFNKNPMLLLEDNSKPSNNQSPKVNSQRCGCPQNQILAVTTNHLTIEPRHELRKQGPVSIQTDDDPWAKLSKASSVTPLSPRRVPQTGPSKQKPVIYLHMMLIKFSKHISSRGPKKQALRKLTNPMKCFGFVLSSNYFYQ